MNELTNVITPLLINLLNFIYSFKIPIGIISFFIIAFLRIAVANAIRIKRKDKVDWVFYGILLGLQIICIFIKIQLLWFIVQLTLISAAIIYLLVVDSSRQVRGTIYSSSIVYEDNSEKFDNNKDPEATQAKAKREGSIKRKYSFSKIHICYGIPVLMIKFVFLVSPLATEEQLAKPISQLNKYYTCYNWRKNQQTNGRKYEFCAELKTNSIMSIPFDKEISDELDWYVVPLGAIDVSTKQTAHETPYVWMMHDPKTEKKSYKCLKKTKTYTAAPQGFVVGQTGGGKSVLINSMIAHWLNKAKSERQVELYLCDAKNVEFAKYQGLEEVAGCAFDLESAVELSNKFVEAMLERNKMMASEGIKKIPLDGKIQLNRNININGHIIDGKQRIKYKDSKGNIKEAYAMALKGRTDILEVEIPEEKQEEEEDRPRW